jgi:hypothetical protein
MHSQCAGGSIGTGPAKDPGTLACRLRTGDALCDFNKTARARPSPSPNFIFLSLFFYFLFLVDFSLRFLFCFCSFLFSFFGDWIVYLRLQSVSFDRDRASRRPEQLGFICIAIAHRSFVAYCRFASIPSRKDKLTVVANVALYPTISHALWPVNVRRRLV